MAINDPPFTQPSPWYIWPDDRLHNEYIVKAPTPNVYPLQRDNQVELLEYSLLAGHVAFDYQDANQILARTLITKGVVDPDYYGELQHIVSLHDAIQRSLLLDTHFRSNA